MPIHETIRLIDVLACSRNWSLFHLDAKFALLNGKLKKNYFSNQPSGFEINENEDMLYRDHKSLWLEADPKIMEQIINKFFVQKGFKMCSFKHGVYVLQIV